jgi:hypothetical protein
MGDMALIEYRRDFVSSVMHEQDPEGFNFRSPTAKKIRRFPKCPIGINERWAGDGHDKLNKIGIMIWAVVDDATSKWLGAWVVPNNRLGAVVAYLALSLIEEMGGWYPKVTFSWNLLTMNNRGSSSVYH